MRMSKDHDIRFLRNLSRLFPVMHHIETHSANLKPCGSELSVGQPQIIISTHHIGWGDLLQPSRGLFIIEVPGMYDFIAFFQDPLYFRPKKSMRVR